MKASNFSDAQKAFILKQGDRRPVHCGGLVHNSERSSQYVSIGYSERLGEAGMEQSVGRVGDSYANLPAETINGLYKAEVILSP